MKLNDMENLSMNESHSIVELIKDSKVSADEVYLTKRAPKGFKSFTDVFGSEDVQIVKNNSNKDIRHPMQLLTKIFMLTIVSVARIRLKRIKTLRTG